MLITQTECLKISVALINAQFIFMGLCLVFLLLLKLMVLPIYQIIYYAMLVWIPAIEPT